MHPSSHDNVVTLFESKFDISYPFRSRIFFCCVTGWEIAVVVDNGRRHVNNESKLYSDVFVPTVCGGCRRRQAATASKSIYDRDVPDVEDVFKEELDVEMSSAVYGGWAVLKATERYCDNRIEVMARMVDFRVIARETKKYAVQLQSAELSSHDEGEGQSLRILHYFDPQFL
ncbi:hypothetical protein KVT40_002340 [Elsinoe batatas]|uniref:Uncharacterized protein n=1 Tax=Elsinoe batatas TaxID=2601811 RepID=A0A8K0PI39_9PEZI|nr:hypothetical protein KVT40_002340 [Elsinoe batatas]